MLGFSGRGGGGGSANFIFMGAGIFLRSLFWTSLFGVLCQAECTKIAHRHSLAIFTADSGIPGIPAVGMSFACCNRIENRRSLATFDRKEISHLGA